MSKLKNTCDTYLLSISHLLDVSNAGKKNRNDKDIIKPNVILLYNSRKAEIDLSPTSWCHMQSNEKSIRLYHKLATEVVFNTRSKRIIKNIKKKKTRHPSISRSSSK